MIKRRSKVQVNMHRSGSWVGWDTFTEISGHFTLFTLRRKQKKSIVSSKGLHLEEKSTQIINTCLWTCLQGYPTDFQMGVIVNLIW